MGQFNEAKFAWMVPISNGNVIPDDPRKPGGAPIVKIPVGEVDEFIAKFSIMDFSYAPLYSGVTSYHGPEVQTVKKRNERSK